MRRASALTTMFMRNLHYKWLPGLARFAITRSPLQHQLELASAAAALAVHPQYRCLDAPESSSLGQQHAGMKLLGHRHSQAKALNTQKDTAGIVALNTCKGLLQRLSYSCAAVPSAASATTSWGKHRWDLQKHSCSSAVVAAASTDDEAGTGSTLPATSETIGLQQDDFQNDYINYVYLQGRVVKGPKLIRFQASNTCKAIMVLGLFNQDTGDRYLDLARPVLIETWGQLAEEMHQQIQPDSLISVICHLACDNRKQARSIHGPALTLKADEWRLINPSSIPPGRHTYEYQGEFDYVFDQQRPRSASSTSSSSSSAAAAAGGQPQQPQQEQSTKRTGVTFRKSHGLELFQQGQQPDQIAARDGVQVRTVVDGLLAAASAEGWSCSAWPALLQHIRLTAEQGMSPDALFYAVDEAIKNYNAPLTKDGQVRLKVIREYILQNCSGVSEAIRQQEAAANGDLNITYRQLKLMVEVRKKGGHPDLLGQ